MRITNPYMKAWANAGRSYRKGLFAAKKQRERDAYLAATHAFRLTIGGEPTERTRNMTGEDAKLVNIELRKAFYAACCDDPDTTAHLHAWVLDESKP